MFGGDCGDVRMMVVHLDDGQLMFVGERRRVSRAEEIGMQVMRNGIGSHVEHRAQMIDGFDERSAGRTVVEIADVWRKKRLIAARYAHGILEISTRCENRG